MKRSLVALLALSLLVFSFLSLGGCASLILNGFKDAVDGLDPDDLAAIVDATKPADPRLTFRQDEKTKNYTVTGYRASEGKTDSEKVVIPSFYNGYPVTAIGESAFEDCTDIKEVVIPATVVSIDIFAFKGCTGLTNVTLPESIRTVGKYAFSGCKGLESVTLPFLYENEEKSISIVFTDIFGKNSSSVRSVTVLGGTSLPDNAFEGCTALTEVILPDTLKTVGNYAFKGCTAIKGITLPKSVYDLGWSVFEGCTSLESITLPQYVTYIPSGAFRGCTSLKNVNLSPKTKEIGTDAFEDCTALTEITLPASLSFINKYAFRFCKNLQNVYFENTAEWYYYDPPRSNIGIPEGELSDSSLIAERLIDSKCSLAWRRSDPYYVPEGIR